jgi:hypothetical protein
LFEGLIYQFVYNLERHRLFNIRLRRWLIFWCLVLPLTIWFKFRGASNLTAALVTGGAVAVLVVMWWASRQRYVRFVARVPNLARVVPLAGQKRANEVANRQPLPTMSRIRVRATGSFEVSGMQRYLVETPSDYTTFETREHCVMARIPHSRFLLLGKSNQDEVGWWYIFFQPDMIRSLETGWLHYGARPRLALRLEIALGDDSPNAILHLSFDEEATHWLVLDDLQNDADLS